MKVYTTRPRIVQTSVMHYIHRKCSSHRILEYSCFRQWCNITEAGEVWCSCYIPSLNKEDKKRNQHHALVNTHIFSDEKLFPALHNVNIPLWLNNQNIMLNTDIVAKIYQYFFEETHEKGRYKS